VQERVKEIRGEISEAVISKIDANVDFDVILSKLNQYFSTGMSNFIRVDENGAAVVDLSTATPEQLDCIQEVYSEIVLAKGGGDEPQRILKTKIRLIDKLKALDQATKMIGGYLEDRAKAVEADALDRLVREISQRGSKPHIIEKDGG